MAIVIALGASLVGATWVYMHSSYTHGGVNLNSLYSASQAQDPFHDLSRVITDMKGPDWRGWGFTGLGAAIESLLIYAQHHLHWWRIHPLGFIIGSGWLTSQVWFSVFVAWFSKLTIMKFGGMPRFLAAKPFFIGLILGEATTAGMWLVLDFILGGVGNSLSSM